MHEMALMGDLLQIVSSDAKSRNIKQVNEIHLIVGEFSNALPDALEMAFLVFKAEKLPFLAEDARLTIQFEKGEAYCPVCEENYEPSGKIAFCPTCKIPSGKLLKGETFKIDSYEGE